MLPCTAFRLRFLILRAPVPVLVVREKEVGAELHPGGEFGEWHGLPQVYLPFWGNAKYLTHGLAFRQAWINSTGAV